MSRKNNKCAQVYATGFGWDMVHPMTSRSEVQETLSMLFARGGVQPACTCNSAKEMIQGNFYQKLKDDAFRL